jgi:hypothetical protein
MVFIPDFKVELDDFLSIIIFLFTINVARWIGIIYLTNRMTGGTVLNEIALDPIKE